MNDQTRHPTPAERDERMAIPLDAEEALRGLLAVEPEETNSVDDTDSAPEDVD